MPCFGGLGRLRALTLELSGAISLTPQKAVETLPEWADVFFFLPRRQQRCLVVLTWWLVCSKFYFFSSFPFFLLYTQGFPKPALHTGVTLGVHIYFLIFFLTRQ